MACFRTTGPALRDLLATRGILNVVGEGALARTALFLGLHNERMRAGGRG
jgi:hypothetical protein